MHFLPALIIAVFVSGEAYASAWTQPENQGLVIITASHSESRRYYDMSGDSKRQPTYQKHTINPYFEYGIYDGITVGGQLSLEAIAQKVPNAGQLTHYGIGDSEFFVRGKIWEEDGFALAAEPMVKLPSPTSPSTTPTIGSSHGDVGMGLSGGYGFNAFDFDHFVNIDTQYRYRFGTPKNQIRINSTAGIGVTENWQLMPQIFITRRLETTASPSFTQSASDDYNLTRAQLSAVYHMRQNTSLQFGGFSDVAGKNTGKSTGIILGMWQKL